MPKRPDVYEATKKYIIAALRCLDKHHSPGPTTALSLERWVRTQPGQFVRQVRLEEAWSPIYGRLGEEIHALPEYERCVTALREDSLIGPQLETLVGTAIGAHRVEVDSIPDGILTRLATKARGWRFDEAQFDELYEEYESALLVNSFAYVLVAPLPGLTSEGLPIPLDEDAVIDTMTEEALSCVRAGLFQPMGGDWPIISIASESALRVTVTLPKVVGEPRPEGRQEEASTLFGRFQDVVERTVLALRLSTNARVVAPGYIHFSKDWPLRGAVSFAPLTSSPRRTTWATAYDVGAKRKMLFVRVGSSSQVRA